MSVFSSKVIVACCHRFLVDMIHLAILPKKEKVDLKLDSVVEIGISVTLIDKLSTYFAAGLVIRDKNVSFSKIGSLRVIALSASLHEVKPIRTIFLLRSS